MRRNCSLKALWSPMFIVIFSFSYLSCHSFFFILLTLVFYRNVWRYHVVIFEEEASDKGGDFVLGVQAILMRPVVKHHMCLTNSTALVQQQKKKGISSFRWSFLSLGFTLTGDSSFPIPLCLICSRWLTNAVLAPAKLKQHLTPNHSNTTRKVLIFLMAIGVSNKVRLLSVKPQSVKRFRKHVI